MAATDPAVGLRSILLAVSRTEPTRSDPRRTADGRTVGDVLGRTVGLDPAGGTAELARELRRLSGELLSLRGLPVLVDETRLLRLLRLLSTRDGEVERGLSVAAVAGVDGADGTRPALPLVIVGETPTALP
ncbi:hypothetical protein FJT64_018586 [Amphibalanus amphitrite]|uniref:Uncharacterized protein n=1 Tax=Amphibalanus amphitrite TaxID=1232801 RepID=A0A6A4X2Z1_AMPAM|nr:hypothetical protein FJT64_018586 [Amphibalanus amphitrite]